jgi:ribonuclease HI
VEPDLIVYLDGGCTQNPGGKLATAAVALQPSGTLIVESSRHAGVGTSNLAEYRALLHAAQLARLLGARRPLFCSDSMLVAQQVNGWWAMRGNGDLHEAHAQCTSALMEFDRWQVKHVPRERNRRADWLVCGLLGHARTLKNPPDVAPIECESDGHPGWAGVKSSR